MYIYIYIYVYIYIYQYHIQCHSRFAINLEPPGTAGDRRGPPSAPGFHIQIAPELLMVP